MSDTINPRVRLLFDPVALSYDFGPHHPMQPRRLIALKDLLECTGLWQEADRRTRLDGRSATLEELRLVHAPDYIAAVERLSPPRDVAMSEVERKEWDELALHYGFADGDTPASPHMHEGAARVAGGTLTALSTVMGLPDGGTFATEEERPLHVFHPAGGWHHALPERASGFCIYNDASVAIAHVLQSTGAKVLYIDFDAHHGDGVQRSFYDDPRVMTVSFHETGRYLFPGTGDVLELGAGTGRGYSVNIPLEPFTEDDSYIEVMKAVLPPLVTSFAPDVIVSEHGCDTHAWDPLTHLHLTMRGILAQIKMAHQLAHTYCGGRWVALGGGGYDPYRVVPRAWTMLWAEMSDQPLPNRLPEVWVERWRPAWEAMHEEEEAAEAIMGKPEKQAKFPTTLQDQPGDIPEQPRRWSISRSNMQTAALVRRLLLPSVLLHAFPTERRRSPYADLFDLLHFNRANVPSRTKVLGTPSGQLLLRDFCPPSLVERLRADNGLHAFAHTPEREHTLLLSIAKSPDSELTLAHTQTGEIVGQVTIAPADEWWEGIENAYEVAIEVSSQWRGQHLAEKLLAFALELDALEDMILFAMGLSWHWDMEGLGIPPYRYRRLIAHLFETQGFKEYETTEPNISMEPANILLARIGRRVDPRVAEQFLSRLRSSPRLGRW
ncbi:MAG TPA: acetoin utilization protein AcuC [Ktedonobacteraceae bacterium]|nr:acetoin utilization protein AcuC [Ktedonobacteraceae bacterium]